MMKPQENRNPLKSLTPLTMLDHKRIYVRLPQLKEKHRAERARQLAVESTVGR